MVLASSPSKKWCFSSKVHLLNRSGRCIKYEITAIKGQSVTGFSCNLSWLGLGGGGEIQLDDAEKLPPQEGFIPRDRQKPTRVTVGGKYFQMKWMYEGLQRDWSVDNRVFSVYDDLVFEPPSEDEIRMAKDAPVVTKYDPDVQCCTFSPKKMCVSGGAAKCPHCPYSYCKYHFPVNNSLIPYPGGHKCP